MSKFRFFYFLIIISLFSCSKDSISIVDQTQEPKLKEITIFHINDVHGSINNFAKIKYLIDQEKKESNVLFVCSGDTFSGNPVVDFYEDKGFPMIDLMNKAGVDVAVLGNHEFDYGETILNDRMNQSNFEWICANIDANNSIIKQPKAYNTLNVNDVKVTFLGLIQASQSNNRLIPATHPWRVKNLVFTHYSDIIRSYSSLKQTEESDIYIGLTHLGLSTDTSIAQNHPFFDIIIGGHSHSAIGKKENNTYIYQAGSYLRNLGKINITIDKNGVITTKNELIDLSTVTEYDATVQTLIDNYNDNPEFDEIIGFAEEHHNKNEVGNFYTETLLSEMNVDLTFQNSGGVRNTLDKGDITIREIYAIDPFNNGSVVYTMTVGEIKTFFRNSGEGLYYAGLNIEQSGNSIIIKNENGNILNDDTSITIGLNDFIPAVNNSYFTSTATIKEFTTAETIINYLKNNSEPINYTGYSNYFKFN